MDQNHPEALKKHMRTAIIVFVLLLFLTLVTVLASRLDLGHRANIALALIIASVKGGLVAAYFMHLIDEKKLIYLILIFCVVFFVVMMALPLAQHYNVWW